MKHDTAPSTASLFGLFIFVAGLSPAFSQSDLRRVADLNPGSAGSYPSNLTVYANNLYFSAYTQATGYELWRFDGTSVRLAADINDTANDIGFGVKEGNPSYPAWLTEYNGILYFSAYEPRRGAELWRFNGTSAARIADISPDANDLIKFAPYSSWPNQLLVFSNALYFSANSGTVTPNYELWRFDGTQVRQVANIRPEIGPDHSSYPQGMTPFNGALFFMADDGSRGYELWKHDGLTTTLLSDINPGGPESSSFPKHFTHLHNHLYFQAYHPDYGFELWKTDGTTVSLAADIASGPASSNPDFFTVHNEALYFRATDGINGYELWRYDGTNLSLVSDINPLGDSYPKNLTVYAGALYFSADDGTHGFELWKYDGTSVTRITDLNTSGDSFPEALTPFEGALYFVATSPDTGFELWKWDGNRVVVAADVNPGAGSSHPQFLTAYSGKLYFRATHTGATDWELWAYTPDKAPVVAITSPSSGTSYPTSQSITVTAEATDDGTITKVEFFLNGNLVGVRTAAPYSLSVNLPNGSHTLLAKATDNSGATTSSAPVFVTVGSANQSPTVSLTSPQAGNVLAAPATIQLLAQASDSDGIIRQVEFFRGTNSLGVISSTPYQMNVENLPAGVYAFTARATDDAESKATSEPLQILVANPPLITSLLRVDGSWEIQVRVTPGIPHVLEGSSNLVSWAPLSTNLPATEITTFRTSSDSEQGFFRVAAQKP